MIRTDLISAASTLRGGARQVLFNSDEQNAPKLPFPHESTEIGGPQGGPSQSIGPIDRKMLGALLKASADLNPALRSYFQIGLAISFLRLGLSSIQKSGGVSPEPPKS